MPTRYNLAREALDEAVAHSYTQEDFFKQLTEMGFKYDFRESRAYATIIPKEYNKSIRIHKLGSEYSKERIFERIKENSMSARQKIIQPPTEPTGYRRVTPRGIQTAKKKGGLRGLYLHYCYKLGILPKGTKRNNARLHYLLKDDLMKLDKISAQVKLLYSRRIDTVEGLSSFMESIKSESEVLKKQRQKLWNETRGITDPDRLDSIKTKISACSSQLKEIRKELALCEDIATRSPVIAKNLEQMEMDEQNISERKERKPDEQWRRRR